MTEKINIPEGGFPGPLGPECPDTLPADTDPGPVPGEELTEEEKECAEPDKDGEEEAPQNP